ncbi:acetyl esterase/lipase [Sphingobium sp. OAS761]|uniref:alpha/beta hydrolase n=1 Tax=Sphingobium sp. OAS761 TaxID=2817901 RepID=UPI00209CA758|nr:alpha/beta hydrolase [Sphingobium sp. OAS761]MCP1470387.1 acetyl esterase/lipase [Sphingobium sp. OAS761]
MTVDEKGMMLDARVIPWPRSVSGQAADALRASASQPRAVMPDPSDTEGWRATIAQVDGAMAAAYTGPVDSSIMVSTEQCAGVGVHRARPESLSADDQRLYIEIHGGALVFGAGDFCRACGARDAALFGVEVAAIDYRMPPDHPFPAALDDCLAVYAAEVERRGAHNIIVGGGSAGGNLAAALMLRARMAGLPMPAALLLLSPEVDLTESGDSFETLMSIDPVLKARLTESIMLYSNGHRLDDPLLSPLFGDLSGFPPTLLQSGTRDLFLSNTVRMHRRLRQAGVAADLHVFEAMPHGGFFDGPEDEEKDREIADFVAAHWARH